jgi:putative endopeptidase
MPLRPARRALWGAALVCLIALLARTFVPAVAASPFGSINVAPGSPEALASAARGFDLSQIDPTCEPCQDFFQFADGGWIKTNPIPANRASWGRFAQLADQNTERLHALLEDAAAHPPADPRFRQVGAYYAACVDTDTIDRLGTTPIADELARAAAVKDLPSLAAELAHLHDLAIPTFFDLEVESNPSGAAKPDILGLGQPQLPLPEKSYYLDPAKAAIRTAYVDHVSKMFALAGDDAATSASEAQTVLTFETSLANLMRAPAELRDPIANTNVMTVAKATMLAGSFPFPTYLTARRLPTAGTIDIGQPTYVGGLANVLSAAPATTLQTVLRWAILNSQAAALAKPFDDENFRFNSTVLLGTKEQLPRWKRCVTATTAALGDSVGMLYDAHFFTPAERARAVVMIHNVKAMLRSDLSTLPWMSAATRTYALRKLDLMAERVGYPDHPQNYDTVAVSPNTYAVNRLNAGAARVRQNLADLGKPMNRTRWELPSPTVNAFYRPDANDITIFAGILQVPFYNVAFDDAINYGGIAMVIGHEMTHGFDDQGRHYDGHGALTDWWTKKDAANFNGRAGCIAKQFDGYVAADDVHENGSLETGEAIADLGGLTIAYRAFERAQAGKPRTLIDGFTPEQRFFLGFATVWASSQRTEAAKVAAATDPHPLPRFRVLGTLANMPAFAKAFSCAAGDPMVRAAKDQCKIW